LGLGTAKIREYLEAHAHDPRKVADGKFLFTLYDTHGFPTDLAQGVCQAAAWSGPPEATQQFEAEMEAQRERARPGASFGAAAAEGDGTVEIYRQLSAQIAKPEFLGSTHLATRACV